MGLSICLRELGFGLLCLRCCIQGHIGRRIRVGSGCGWLLLQENYSSSSSPSPPLPLSPFLPCENEQGMGLVLGYDTDVIGCVRTSYSDFSCSARALSRAACSMYGCLRVTSVTRIANTVRKRTFFSDSSSSFHFAPRSLPISPRRRAYSQSK